MSIIQWSLPIPSSSIVLLLLTTKQQIWMFKNGLKIILIVENMFRNDASLRSSSKTCASIFIFCRRLKTKLTSSNKKKKNHIRRQQLVEVLIKKKRRQKAASPAQAETKQQARPRVFWASTLPTERVLLVAATLNEKEHGEGPPAAQTQPIACSGSLPSQTPSHQYQPTT